MEDILIYYNQNSNTFILKQVSGYSYRFYKVGYTNQFNHILVEIWSPINHRLVTIDIKEEIRKNRKELVFRNRLINLIEGFLDKLKK